jgi:fumarate reductase flavoprotein subunit
MITTLCEGKNFVLSGRQIALPSEDSLPPEQTTPVRARCAVIRAIPLLASQVAGDNPAMDQDNRIHVLIAGGGACGAVAALAAHEAGADVLVLEQDAAPRGSTAMSQGLICAAGTTAQRTAGIDDDADRFFADIIAKTRGQTDPALARAVADHAGPTLDWLIQAHDLPHGLDVRFRAAYGHSVPRVHGWLGHGGEDLIQFLHARLQARGIDVLFRARLADVVAGPDGRVHAAIVERPDGSCETIGCNTLILATCGFAANARMVAAHMPELAHATHHGHEGNDGAGLLLGARVGGALADMGAYQGYGMLTDPQSISVPPGFLVEGAVLVNAAGERFVHETDDISGLVLPILAQPGGVAWVIYDAGIEARCAYIPETQALLALNAPRAADTPALLAHRIGADPAALQRALERARAAAEAGWADELGRVWGADRPPHGPLRAMKVRGALYHTQGGLQVDGRARVLRPDGAALPNLFAGGGAARGLSGPGGWGYLPAMGLCAAVTLGALAGRAAAAWVAD